VFIYVFCIQLSCWTFLFLYGIILLTDFHPAIDVKEIILMIWVLSLFTEEVRQVLLHFSRFMHLQSPLTRNVCERIFVTDSITEFFWRCLLLCTGVPGKANITRFGQGRSQDFYCGGGLSPGAAPWFWSEGYNFAILWPLHRKQNFTVFITSIMAYMLICSKWNYKTVDESGVTIIAWLKLKSEDTVTPGP